MTRLCAKLGSLHVVLTPPSGCAYHLCQWKIACCRYFSLHSNFEWNEQGFLPQIQRAGLTTVWHTTLCRETMDKQRWMSKVSNLSKTLYKTIYITLQSKLFFQFIFVIVEFLAEHKRIHHLDLNHPKFCDLLACFVFRFGQQSYENIKILSTHVCLLFTEQGMMGKTEIQNRNKFKENCSTKVTKIQKKKKWNEPNNFHVVNIGKSCRTWWWSLNYTKKSNLSHIAAMQGSN